MEAYEVLAGMKNTNRLLVGVLGLFCVVVAFYMFNSNKGADE